MANEIITKDIASASFSLTMASLADATSAQSALISNTNDYPAAHVYLKIKSSASAPTAGTTYKVYLLRGDGTIRDDSAAATAGTITIENAPMLGTIQVTATASKEFFGVFDTGILGPLGTEWGIAIKNDTGQAISGTEGDHDYNYSYYVPEVQ